MTVNWVTTFVNTDVLQVKDKNIELGKTWTPTDTTADWGWITLLWSTDKTIIWDNANDNWTSNQDWNIATWKAFKINNVDVLNATTLWSAIVNSSLTSVWTLTSLTMWWNIVIWSNNITMTWSISDTTNRVLKGWFTDLESTNDITIGWNALASIYSPIAWSSSITTIWAVDSWHITSWFWNIDVWASNIETTGNIWASWATIVDWVVATTQTAWDGSTKIATTAYADNAAMVSAKWVLSWTEIDFNWTNDYLTKTLTENTDLTIINPVLWKKIKLAIQWEYTFES